MLPTTALALSVLSLGVASSPHCALMCGAACAGVSGTGARGRAAFQAGRLVGYAAAGAVVGGSMAALAHWSTSVPALRPAWVLLHLGLAGLGSWWLLTGRPARLATAGGAAPVQILRPGQRSLRAGLSGLAWVALPCGALQGALLLAALGGDAASGALLMLLFALASAPALSLAPWLWARLGGGVAVQALGRRIAGLGMVLMSGWALTEGLWRQLAAWCA